VAPTVNISPKFVPFLPSHSIYFLIKVLRKREKKQNPLAPTQKNRAEEVEAKEIERGEST